MTSDKKAYNKQYYEANKEKLLPKIRKRAKDWAKKNMPHICAKQKERRINEKKIYGKTKNSESSKRYRDRLKADVIEKMGGKCKCCGAAELDFLSVDHVSGGGCQHVKKHNLVGGGALWRHVRDSGYSKDYQLLCHNCNYSKFLGNGVCAHKRQKP